MYAATQQAYQLMHEGVLALAEVEHNGIRIDTEYLKTTIEKTREQVKEKTIELRKDPLFKEWHKRFGEKTKLGSRPQLGKILFEALKIPTDQYTDSGRYKTDAQALEFVDVPFVKKYLEIERLKKVLSTYLSNILREVCDGFLHPSFNLHLVETFRSSCDRPNFQNIPMRIPEIAELVRRAFIPRGDDFVIGETDYSGAEIRASACYHHDPKMIAYIKDKSLDMHRDMAMQLYQLPKEEITKYIRHCGKNMFVFPQFYGDFYVSCARALWDAIQQMNLVTTSGIPLKKHLRQKGIRELGDCDPSIDPRPHTFESHVKEVEKDFWNNRFKVYNSWKKDWCDAYLKQGYIETLTGFYIAGDYRRNQIINTPIQGSAFHWLLWSLIRINKLLKKYNMKTKLIGQIHDSIIADIHRSEIGAYMDITHQVMTVDIRKHWDWICVPLETETEICPLGKSWFDKKQVEIINGAFTMSCPTCKEKRKYSTEETLLAGMNKKKCKRCA
jgi:DNA polymerase-1